MKISFLVSFLLVFLSLNGQNQCNLTITGRVIDKHDGEPLAFATISLLDNKLFEVTDDQGSYQIKNICPGSIHVRVEHLGCEPKSLYIDLKADTILHFEMEHHSEILSVIDVTDFSRQAFQNKSGYEISGNYLSKYKSRSLADVARLIPGVESVKSGANISKPLIQGLTGNRISMVNDGVILEGQQWGADHSPEMDISNAGKLKVIKGSAAILFGSVASSGAIISETESAKNNDPHLHGRMRYNFQSNGRGHHTAFQLYKGSSVWDYYLGGAAKRAGDLHTPDYYLRNTGLSEQSLDFIAKKITDNSSLKYTLKYYRFNAGILRSAHIGNLTDLTSALAREVPFFTEDRFYYQIGAPRQLVHHGTAQVNYLKNINTQSSYNIKYTLQSNSRREFDVRRADRTGRPVVNMLLTSNNLEVIYENQWTSQLKFLAGSGLRANINYNLPGTGTSSFLPDYRLINPNTYALLTAKINKKIQTELGLRFENHQYFVDRWVRNEKNSFRNNFNSFNINAGLGAKLYENISLKTDLTYVSRPPQINELYSRGLHQGVAAYEEGNSTLTNENSVKSVTDVSFDFHHFGQFTLSGFIHRIDNFIYLLPRKEQILTIRGAFFAFDYTNSDTWLRGLEGIYKVNLNHNTEWLISGSLIRSFERTTKEEILWTPPPSLKSHISHDFYLSNEKKSEMNITLSTEHVFKNKFVDPSFDFLPPPPAFTLVNADFTLKNNLFGNPVQISFSVQNLLNTKYRNYLNRFRYFADEPGRSFDLTLLYNF